MEAYSISLDIFCGPLDLLLQLIKTDEIEITSVSLARVADQFVQHLRAMDFSDLEVAADFVVVACHLCEIKSRELLPKEEQGDEIEDINAFDKGSDLIAKLLEYRAFKDRARALGAMATGAHQRHLHGMLPDLPPLPVDPGAVLRGVTLWDLVSAFARIAKEILFDPRQKIIYDDLPIGDYIDMIMDFVRSRGETDFSVVVKGHARRSRVIGAFLALLEMAKRRWVKLGQDEEFGEIQIKETPRSEVEAFEAEFGSSAVDEDGDGAGIGDSDSLGTDLDRSDFPNQVNDGDPPKFVDKGLSQS